MTLKSKNGMYFSVSAGLPPRGLLLYHGEGVNFVSLWPWELYWPRSSSCR